MKRATKYLCAALLTPIMLAGLLAVIVVTVVATTFLDLVRMIEEVER